jgi:aminoglycoside phosphotransferase (APT) family kinase protein
MIAALECLDVATAGWLAQRDPALVHLPEAVAAAEPGWNLHDVQWLPGRGCRLAYEVKDAPTQTSRYIAVTLDPNTWSHHDFRSDPGLPGLVAASDPVLVTERLAAVVEVPILHCRVQPVRYRPDQRCVLRYDLRTAAGAARYYAKVFSSSVFADAAGRTTRVTAAARPVGLRVSQVLAVWPDLHTTVAGAVDGRSASTVLRDAAVSLQRRIDLAGDLGGLLADLHTLTGVLVPTRTPSDYLREVADLLPSARIVDAALADRLSRLIDRLDGRLPVSDHREILIHGAFRPGQVIVDDAGLLHLLDLDGVGRGAAAQDLGSVSGHLSWQAIRQPSQELELRMIDEALRAGHGLRGPAVDPASLAWWRAAALAQIGARRFRRLEVAHWALVPQLIELAESLLDGSPEGRTR